jgi:hypothetical protein
VDAFRALFASPIRRSMRAAARRRRRTPTSTLDLADAPADWVPFADGTVREWANDTCVRVPKVARVGVDDARPWRRDARRGVGAPAEADQASVPRVAAVGCWRARWRRDDASSRRPLIANVGTGVPLERGGRVGAL